MLDNIAVERAGSTAFEKPTTDSPTSGKTVTLTFDGLLEPSSFCQFLRHRAIGLDLHLDIYHVDRDCAELRVIGRKELIDAFELACALGPTDCQIDRVTRRAG